MVIKSFLLFFILWLLCYTPASAQNNLHNTAAKRISIAFGSCNNQRDAQPLWKEIIKNKPDLWVWLGDNIYADTYDMSLMASYYQLQLQHPGYQELLKTTPVTGIWDDHDYAGDNANKCFPYKAQSQQLFLDFIGVPKEAPLRQQKGIYRSYIIRKGDKKIKLILLDGMYFRDPYLILFGIYLPNRKADLLGEAQWQWLEKELTNSEADLHIIASGLQVLPTGHAYTNWSAFPTERKRLLRLLEKTKPAIPILISGDRHVGELSKTKLKGYTYPLYEVTASGMTHHRKARKAGNNFRVGQQVGTLNFGILHISLGEKFTSITMQIRGEQNNLYLQNTYNFPTP